MPLSPNVTMLWAQVLVEELARSGVAHACVAPGNRSGPLAFALAAQPGVRVWSHVDERSMGFFALGLAKAARGPVAAVCTSGTAAANLLPAAVEAWHARVPLVLLTADRPPDLRDTGANQAIHQAGLFGAHVRWAADLARPVAEDRALRHLRTQACRAVAAARGPPAGPVHLNVPLVKPLEPTPAPGDVPADLAARHPLAAQGRPGGAPFVRATASPRAPEPARLATVAEVLRAPRALVVVGPQDDPDLPAAAARLAEAAGFPLLADPLSGMRFGPHAQRVLGAYDAALHAPAARALVPDVVLRLGAAPTSDTLSAWLEGLGVPQVVVDDDPGWRDPLHLPGERVVADPARACAALASLLAETPEPAWRAAWDRAERAAAGSLARSADEAFFEGSAVRAVLDALPDGGALFVSNSLPVRELDRFGAPRAKALRVLGNRGASGIDGITSTALGAAAGGAGPLALVTGDLAFYHDLPGLLALRRCGVEAVLVVLHNDGGRIFDQLPAARHDPPFRELFVTPTGLDFEPAARMFGARFRRVEGAKALREEVAAALAGGAHVIEARIDPAESLRARTGAQDAAAHAVERALRGAAGAR